MCLFGSRVVAENDFLHTLLNKVTALRGDSGGQGTVLTGFVLCFWCVSHVTILLLALLYALEVPNGLCMLQSFVVRQSGPLSSHPRLISLRRGWEWRSLSWWIACALEPMFSYYLPFIPPLPASSLAAHFLMFMADFDVPCVWRCLVPQKDTQCAGLHCFIAQLFIFLLAPEGSGHNLDMKPGRADMEGAPEATRCLFLTLFTPNLSFLALWVASATAHMRTHTHWHTYTEYSLWVFH